MASPGPLRRGRKAVNAVAAEERMAAAAAAAAGVPGVHERIAQAEDRRTGGGQAALELERHRELPAFLTREGIEASCLHLNRGPGAPGCCQKYNPAGEHMGAYHYWHCCRCGFAQAGFACVNDCDWGRFGWTCIIDSCIGKGCPCKRKPKSTA
mmetsp:Transcript_21138/g.31239  ORF Transcript_21138/g.31239 Transcript_21138/m.31239 type:complete len:153 (+) Transcript_21138:137-595(+)